MEKLVSKTFQSVEELTEYVNNIENDIVQTDIITINNYVANNGQQVFYILYYSNIMTDENIEDRSKPNANDFFKERIY